VTVSETPGARLPGSLASARVHNPSRSKDLVDFALTRVSMIVNEHAEWLNGHAEWSHPLKGK